MKLILIPLSLALASCTALPGIGTLPPPAAVAERTLADEQAAQGAELAYKAFRTALEIAVDTGFLKGAAAARAAELDRRAFAALGVARKAYTTANSTDYLQAVANARAAIDDALASVKGS